MTTNLNSALYWLPRLERAQLPMPATVIVRYSHEAACIAMAGEGHYRAGRVISSIRRALEKVGLPAFVRSDLASAKHQGPEAYLLRGSSSEEIERVFWQTVEDNDMKFWLSQNTPHAILVRQFLELDAPFRAFAAHPIAREWRYFTEGSRVVCKHFYWPESAIKFWGSDGEPAGWREQLRAMADEEPPASFAVLAECAVSVLRPHDWSVDFARDRQGKWWLIDCALAADSWHPGHKEGLGERDDN